MLVSFIIPAYNAESTIVRCLESIHDMSLGREEFEVIVVDDCSSDNTVEVIELYRQQMYGARCKVYDHFTLLRQSENHRQGAARNRGVKIAKGEYICFVDADDTVMEGMVTAIRLAKETNSDMTALHYAFANEQGVITSESPKLPFIGEGFFSGIEMQNIHPYWCSAPWGFIYRREFLEHVGYPFVEDVLFEDSDFVVIHLFCAKRMVYSPDLGYLTYYREGSTTRSTNFKNVADYLLLGYRMLRYYQTIVSNQETRGDNQELEMFAEGILEGACFNIARSCKRIIKLSSIKEVQLYYKRVDEHIKRNDILHCESVKKYYWHVWNTICIGHRYIAVLCFAIVKPIYKVYQFIR